MHIYVIIHMHKESKRYQKGSVTRFLVSVGHRKGGGVMPSAMDVARYFLAVVPEEEGDFMTNLKLQKLLYYAQGFHLAILDKVLFPDEILKWTHGPVVPEVYFRFRQHGSSPIPYPEDEELPEFPQETTEVLNEVFDVYGQFTAWALRNLTHNEPPYINAEDNSVISQESIGEYFKTQLVE